MSIIFDQYAERLNRLKRKESTKIGFARARDSLERYLDEVGLEAERIEPHELEEYFAGLDYAATTKKLHLTHIGAAYRYAHRRGLVSRDPTVDVQLERVPDKEPRIIPNAELRAMKKKLLTNREWLAFHLLVYTGMRRHEILDLRWEKVSMPDSTITVLGKGGKLRHVPIHPALWDVLNEDRYGEYVLTGRGDTKTSVHTLWNVVNTMTDGAYTPHDFRRTVASSLFLNEVNGDLIDEIMGWAKRGMRRRYYQAIAPAQLQRAILRLYRDDPI